MPNNIEMLKVTVLMSVYNGEKYLREAVDSILNQKAILDIILFCVILFCVI